jgi:hypothetical protein
MAHDRKQVRTTTASHRSAITLKKPRDTRQRAMKVLVIDVGGTHIKVFQTGRRAIEIDSGPKMTPRKMTRRVLNGGNVKHLQRLPIGVRRGKNTNAFRGGMMLCSRSGR